MAVVNLEGRVRKDHPLRTIKSMADEALERLSGDCGSQTNGTLGTVDSVGPRDPWRSSPFRGTTSPSRCLTGPAGYAVFATPPSLMRRMQGMGTPAPIAEVCPASQTVLFILEKIAASEFLGGSHLEMRRKAYCLSQGPGMGFPIPEELWVRLLQARPHRLSGCNTPPADRRVVGTLGHLR